jgi:YgiT-type zinc finger domain-containing protein
MTSPENEITTIYPCRECQAGKLRPQHVTYLTWLGDELISVPDFPAWVCDVCGRREYDLTALNRLSLLLSPHAGKTPQRRQPITPHPRAKPRRSSQP